MHAFTRFERLDPIDNVVTEFTSFWTALARLGSQKFVPRRVMTLCLADGEILSCEQRANLGLLAMELISVDDGKMVRGLLCYRSCRWCRKGYSGKAFKTKPQGTGQQVERSIQCITHTQLHPAITRKQTLQEQITMELGPKAK